MNDLIGPDLTEIEARALTDGIREALFNVWPMIIEAYRRRAWLALGYGSWDLYCDRELAGMRPAIESREQRREAVGQMREAGMSQRAIADAVDVDQKTVRNDLIASRIAEPEYVQASDGRTFARSSMTPITSPADPWEGWTNEERQMRKAVEAGEAIVASKRGAHARVITWAEGAELVERIDRRSQWGNPFEIHADGDRDTVIKNYEDHYLPHKPSLIVKLSDLRGRLLTCWCAPEPCHGDVLKRWAER